MISIPILIIIFCLYMGILFLVALQTERSQPLLKKISEHPFVYASALGIYCTTWTHYGSVGMAATSGLIFLSIYLGPTLAIFLWGSTLKKIVRIKHIFRITSIADFISARYNKSQSLAAIVTIIALIGVVPYVALQLRATQLTLRTLSAFSEGPKAFALDQYAIGMVVALMILFTILFGARRLDPTESHKGMLFSVAIQSLVQLGALLCVGIFITFFIFDGFNDIFDRIDQQTFGNMVHVGTDINSYMIWGTYLILAMSAIMFLPRQFHVTVVENSNENHIPTAMWFFPLYMLLMNIFVVPIAMAGLLENMPIEQVDTFVLRLPLRHNQFWLTIVVFLGGISAATSMIMISSMTVATMMTNHLLLPILGWTKRLDFLRKHLLRCRWVFITIFILLSYLFESRLQQSYLLVNIGLISFAAVLQFAPVMIGGIYWRAANKRGAIMGLCGGFVIWFYTLLLPAMIRSGWGPQNLIDHGPWGISLLRPESLFGISLSHNMVHAVFWSMIVNIGLYVYGSLSIKSSEEEQKYADEFVDILRHSQSPREILKGEETIELADKTKIIRDKLKEYFNAYESENILRRCLKNTYIENKEKISILELAELQSETEKMLTGSLGSSVAHKTVSQMKLLTQSESKQLSETYAQIMAYLKLTPRELIDKIDYRIEREGLLTQHAKELEEKIERLDEEINKRKDVEHQLIVSSRKYQNLLETIPQRIFHKDLRSNYLYCNDVFASDLGIDRSIIVGKNDYDFFSIELAEKYRADDKEVIETGQSKDVEESYTVDGEMRWVHTVKTPLRDVEDNIVGLLGIFWDITERKQAEDALIKTLEEKETLLKEIHHRVKNNMLFLYGLIDFQQGTLGDKPYMHTILEETKQRIKAICHVHQLLYQSKSFSEIDFSDFIREIVQEVSNTYNIVNKNVVVTLEAQPIKVNIDVAIPCSLIVNELMTNIYKHAFVDKDEGEIKVALKKVGDQKMIAVCDNGVGVRDDFNIEEINTLGLTLVKMMVRQIEGQLSLQKENGSKFIITF